MELRIIRDELQYAALLEQAKELALSDPMPGSRDAERLAVISVLLEKFADLWFQGNVSIDKVAVVMDIRGREFFSGLLDALKYMDDNGYVFEVLFLYADEDELVNNISKALQSKAKQMEEVETLDIHEK